MEDFIVQLSIEEELLRQVIEPLLDSEGYELVRIRLKKTQSKSMLALFVDKASEKNSIAMENLEDVSRLLSDVLDACDENGVLRGRYDLEVSSPGLDRPLSKRSHFAEAIGDRVKIRLKSTDNPGIKNISGVLAEASDDGVMLIPDGKKEDEKIGVLFSDMADAHIVFDFSKLEKNKKKTRSH